jgi:subtilisin family serine protease
MAISRTDDRVAAHLLVKFQHHASSEHRDLALASVGGEIERSFGFDGREHVLRVKLPDGADVAKAAGALGGDPAVAYAEPDYIVHIEATSNDPLYTGGRMWGMEGDSSTPANAYGSQAAEAWAAGYTGSTKVAVGVVDTGVDYKHPDLYLNIWLNPGEIPTALRASLADTDSDGIITFRDLNASANAAYVRDVNANGRIDAGDLLNDSRWENGIDEDGNGYRDDLVGWDFANNDNDPYDDNGHGTHTSGTIAATGGNGIGVAGVTWSTLIVPLKFLDASGSGYTSDAVRALDYFTAAAARSSSIDFVATNNSWGGGGPSTSLYDAIVRGARQDILFVAAAGNGGSDHIGDNNNLVANYPSNYNTTSAVGFDAVIGVAAISSNGALASFSNYGSTTVELGAPGVSIASTVPGGYSSYSGTSMATPHVTGAVALFAAATGADAATIRADLLASGAPTASLTGKTMTGDRLDVMSLMQLAGATPPPPPPPPPVSSANHIYGTSQSDTLVGTSGDDIISGIPAGGSQLGKGTIDTLSGNGGDDLFVLGDARGRFYDDGRTRQPGESDYAQILDFSTGDQVQLKGSAADYQLKALTLNGTSGIGIYFDANHNHAWDLRDELIGLVAGSHTLVSADLLFV